MGSYSATAIGPHPNDVDRKRIERMLAQRKRYRYVAPEVSAVAGGYRVRSPCCSRNVDRSGGMIDIARMEYDLRRRLWRLYRKDHRNDQWLACGEFATLAESVQQLNQDPERIFWQ